MKEKPRVKNPRILTPLRKPPRLEGVVENIGIKPERKKSRKEIRKHMDEIKKKENRA